jgi:hypothetical protein
LLGGSCFKSQIFEYWFKLLDILLEKHLFRHFLNLIV